MCLLPETQFCSSTLKWRKLGPLTFGKVIMRKIVDTHISCVDFHNLDDTIYVPLVLALETVNTAGVSNNDLFWSEGLSIHGNATSQRSHYHEGQEPYGTTS